MKKVLSLLAVALLFAVACHNKQDGPKTPAIAGEWQLTSIEVKSVDYAGQTLDVYLSFAEDGSFELYQMIGQGRFYKYSGTWTITGSTLSGKYASGKDWASSYEVSVSGESLTLVSSVSGETDVYQKVSIPDSVKDYSYEK